MGAGVPSTCVLPSQVSSKWRTKLEVEGPKQRQDNKEDAKDGEAEGGNQTGTSNDASKEKLVLVSPCDVSVCVCVCVCVWLLLGEQM